MKTKNKTNNLLILIIIALGLLAIGLSFATAQSRYKTPYQKSVSNKFTKKKHNKRVKFHKQGYLYDPTVKKSTRKGIISSHRKTGISH